MSSELVTIPDDSGQIQTIQDAAGMLAIEEERALELMADISDALHDDAIPIFQAIALSKRATGLRDALRAFDISLETTRKSQVCAVYALRAVGLAVEREHGSLYGVKKVGADLGIRPGTLVNARSLAAIADDVFAAAIDSLLQREWKVIGPGTVRDEARAISNADLHAEREDDLARHRRIERAKGVLERLPAEIEDLIESMEEATAVLAARSLRLDLEVHDFERERLRDGGRTLLYNLRGLQKAVLELLGEGPS